METPCWFTSDTVPLLAETGEMMEATVDLLSAVAHCGYRKRKREKDEREIYTTKYFCTKGAVIENGWRDCDIYGLISSNLAGYLS